MDFRSIKEVATRPDFVQLMDTGMKMKMMDAYQNAVSEYEQLVSFEDSTKDKETYPSLSGIGYPEKVLENESYKEAEIGRLQSVEITNYKYGRILAISRELVDDDQTKRIKEQPGRLGVAHRNYENKTVFSAIVGGTTAATCYDGLAIYTTNHLNRKGGAAQANNDNIYTGVTMSAGAIIVALSMIALWKGLNDEEITVNPVAIVSGARLAFTARWLMSGTGIPTYGANALGPANSAVNLTGKGPLPLLKPIACNWLDKCGGGALDWYIWTDVPGWVFQTRDPLELYAEGNLSQSWFERDVMRWKSRKRFGFGNIDWRASMLIS